jgi:hypothetical protein
MEAMIVVNPAWRRLNQSLRRESARLYRLRAEFGARTLPPQPSAQQVEDFERRGGEVRDKIQAQELKLNLVFSSVPEHAQFINRLPARFEDGERLEPLKRKSPLRLHFLSHKQFARGFGKLRSD